jgi:hypothetical protein
VVLSLTTLATRSHPGSGPPGIPLVEVAAWMGHSLRVGGAEVNMTSRAYAHATGEHREAALGELERFYRMATESRVASRAS